MTEYLSCLKNKTPFPKNAVVLTFDDGYKDLLTNAHPILEKHGLPATFFVSSSQNGSTLPAWWDVTYNLLSGLFIEKYEMIRTALNGMEVERFFSRDLLSEDAEIRRRTLIRFIEELQNVSEETRNRFIAMLQKKTGLDIKKFSSENSFLTGDDLKFLSAEGMDIQSHGRTHVFLSKLDMEDIQYEIQGSKQELEQLLKKEIVGFTYPGGDYLEHIKKITRDFGYQYAVTADNGINSKRTNPWALKRIMIGNEDISDKKRRFSKSLFAFLYFKATMGLS